MCHNSLADRNRHLSLTLQLRRLCTSFVSGGQRFEESHVHTALLSLPIVTKNLIDKLFTTKDGLASVEPLTISNCIGWSISLRTVCVYQEDNVYIHPESI